MWRRLRDKGVVREGADHAPRPAVGRPLGATHRQTCKRRPPPSHSQGEAASWQETECLGSAPAQRPPSEVQ